MPLLTVQVLSASPVHARQSVLCVQVLVLWHAQGAEQPGKLCASDLQAPVTQHARQPLPWQWDRTMMETTCLAAPSRLQLLQSARSPAT